MNVIKMIRAVDQHGVNQTIEYLEKSNDFYVEDIAFGTAPAYANSKEFETSIIKKWLKLKHKFKGENNCITFK